MVDISEFKMYNCTVCGFVKIRHDMLASGPCGRCGGVVESGHQSSNSLGGNYERNTYPQGQARDYR